MYIHFVALFLIDDCSKLPPNATIGETEDSEDDGEWICDEDVAITNIGSDSEDDINNAETNFAYAVWAKYYCTWYPAKGVSENELPASLKKIY